jgi:hypothetical protein
MDDDPNPLKLDYETPEARPDAKPLSLMQRLAMWFGLTIAFTFVLPLVFLVIEEFGKVGVIRFYLLFPSVFIVEIVNPRGVSLTQIVVSSAMFYALLISFGVRRRK